MGNLSTISALAHECIVTFDAIEKRLVQSVKSPDDISICHEIEDSRGRFNVWANGVGALQEPSSTMSLDSQLKKALVIWSAFISALERLKQSLFQISKILNGQQPNRTYDPTILCASENVGERNELPTSELQELALSAIASVSHLFGLSVVMRRVRPKRNTAYLYEATGSPQDVARVMDMFPKVREQAWLAKRLGNAIGKRRIFLDNRQRRREELVNDEYQVTGRRIPDLPDMILDGNPLNYGRLIKCPYCWKTIRFDSRPEWKKHVFSDLRPYSCVFKGCGAELFSTRDDWIKHETNLHRRRWKCIRCDGFRDNYVSESDFMAHFRQSHSNTITEEQASIILKACEEPQTKFSSLECPLCFEWNPVATQTNNTKRFFRHLAQHQQQLALESLPLSIEGLEIKDLKAFKVDSEPSSESEDEVLADDEEVENTKPARRQAVNTAMSKSIGVVDNYALSQKDIY